MRYEAMLGVVLNAASEGPGRGEAPGIWPAIAIIVGIALAVLIVAMLVTRLLIPAYRRSRRGPPPERLPRKEAR